ncbi:MAG: ATP-binding protein [Aliidongia sp.]
MTDRSPTQAETLIFSADCELLFELSIDMSWATSATGQFIRMNRAVTDFLGRSAETLIGLPFLDIVHDDDRPSIREAMAHLPSTAPVVCEGRIQARDGGWRWIEWRCRSRDGLIFAVGRDLTESERQRALGDVEEDLLLAIADERPIGSTLDNVCEAVQTLLEGTICSVMLFSADGGHLLVGAGPNLAPGYRAVIDGAAIGPAAGSCGTAAFLGETVVVEDIMKDPLWVDYRDAATRYGLRSCWSTPLVSRKQRRLGTFAVYRTVCYSPGAWERHVISRLARSTAIALQRKHFELELIEARQRAERASQVKSDFLAHMSHELRTPLNAIIGFTDIMQHQMLGPLSNPRYQEYVRDINASGHHLLHLIDDILDVARIEAGKIEVNRTRVALRTLLEETIRLVRNAYPVTSHEIELAGPAEFPDLFVDRHCLRQIALNVVGNAAKFTPAGGRVLVAVAHADGGGLEIAVSDTGIGIPASAVPMMGRAFEQVEKGFNRQRGGSGLGLYITRMLMERHGGRLDLRSTVQVGTTVTLSFPADAIWCEAAAPSRVSRHVADEAV